MLTEKDYCDYETCVALREVGCRIETEWYIHQPSYERGSCYLCFGIPRDTSVLDECDYISRLSLYEAQKWLREEKDIHIEIPIWLTDDGVWKYNFRLQTREFYDRAIGEWSSYEEALSEGVKECVKLLQHGNN